MHEPLEQRTRVEALRVVRGTRFFLVSRLRVARPTVLLSLAVTRPQYPRYHNSTWRRKNPGFILGENENPSQLSQVVFHNVQGRTSKIEIGGIVWRGPQYGGSYEGIVSASEDEDLCYGDWGSVRIPGSRVGGLFRPRANAGQ